MEERLLGLVRDVYNAVGWPGVAVLMAIESACIPFPSEVIMPFAGWFLVRAAGLSFWWIFPLALVGAVGNLAGSLLGYWLGAKGGRPFLSRYGKYLLISPHDLEVADRWFEKRGSSVIFISRLIPVIRTFISVSAGVARMDLKRFSVFTLAGCYIFSLGLTFGGYVLGQKWDTIQNVMRPFDMPVMIIFVLLIALYVWHHYRRAWVTENKPSRITPNNVIRLRGTIKRWSMTAYNAWVNDPVVGSILLVAGMYLSIAGWATRHLWDSDKLFASAVFCALAGITALLLRARSKGIGIDGE